MFGGMSDRDAVPVRAFDASGVYPDDAVDTAEAGTDLSRLAIRY